MRFARVQRSVPLVDFLSKGMGLPIEDETGAGNQEVVRHLIQVRADGE